jgi:hypothetical protein
MIRAVHVWRELVDVLHCDLYRLVLQDQLQQVVVVGVARGVVGKENLVAAVKQHTGGEGLAKCEHISCIPGEHQKCIGL